MQSVEGGPGGMKASSHLRGACHHPHAAQKPTGKEKRNEEVSPDGPMERIREWGHSRLKTVTDR